MTAFISASPASGYRELSLPRSGARRAAAEREGAGDGEPTGIGIDVAATPGAWTGGDVRWRGEVSRCDLPAVGALEGLGALGPAVRDRLVEQQRHLLGALGIYRTLERTAVRHASGVRRHAIVGVYRSPLGPRTLSS